MIIKRSLALLTLAIFALAACTDQPDPTPDEATPPPTVEPTSDLEFRQNHPEKGETTGEAKAGQFGAYFDIG